MAYALKTSRQFEKSLKRCVKRGFPIDKLKEVLGLLVQTGTLPPQYKPLINFMAIVRENGNAIYNPIGFLYGNKITMN